MNSLSPEFLLGGGVLVGLIVALIAMLRGKAKPGITPINHEPREYDDESATDEEADTLDLDADRTDRDLDDLADSNAELRARLDKLH